jgi:hypothetical protein
LPFSISDFGDEESVVAEDDAVPDGLVDVLDDDVEGDVVALEDVVPPLLGVALLLVDPDGDVVVDDDAGGVAGGVTTVVLDDDVGGVDDEGADSWRCWQAPRASSTLAATAVVIRRFMWSLLEAGVDELPLQDLAGLVPRSDAPAVRTTAAHGCVICVREAPTAWRMRLSHATHAGTNFRADRHGKTGRARLGADVRAASPARHCRPPVPPFSIDAPHPMEPAVSQRRLH